MKKIFLPLLFIALFLNPLLASNLPAEENGHAIKLEIKNSTQDPVYFRILRLDHDSYQNTAYHGMIESNMSLGGNNQIEPGSFKIQFSASDSERSIKLSKNFTVSEKYYEVKIYLTKYGILFQSTDTEKPWLHLPVPKNIDKNLLNKYYFTDYRDNSAYYALAYEEKTNRIEEKIEKSGEYLNIYFVQPDIYKDSILGHIWKVVVDLWIYDAENQTKTCYQLVYYSSVKEKPNSIYASYDVIIESNDNLVLNAESIFIQDEDHEQMYEYFLNIHKFFLENLNGNLY